MEFSSFSQQIDAKTKSFQEKSINSVIGSPGMAPEGNYQILDFRSSLVSSTSKYNINQISALHDISEISFNSYLGTGMYEPDQDMADLLRIVDQVCEPDQNDTNNLELEECLKVINQVIKSDIVDKPIELLSRPKNIPK
jgi:hypothetical protein